MIDTAYVSRMARYNRWQNLYGVADTLPDDARRRECGAFFASVHKTLSHLLWGDRIWMSRFTPAAPADAALPVMAGGDEGRPQRSRTGEPGGGRGGRGQGRARSRARRSTRQDRLGLGAAAHAWPPDTRTAQGAGAADQRPQGPHHRRA